MVNSWNLENLYTSFNSDKIKIDIENCKNIALKLVGLVDLGLSNVQKIEYYINMQNEFGDIMTRLSNFAELTLCTDVSNIEALKLQEIVHNIYMKIVKEEVKFIEWLGCIKNIDKEIDSSPLLKEHEYYIKELVRKSAHILSQQEEEIIANMKNTGSNAFAKLQNNLISSVTVDLKINGEFKTVPLSISRNTAYQNNQVLRREAYFAEAKEYKRIEQASAACLNGIKGESIFLSKLKGYSSTLEETLVNSRMEASTLDAMYGAVKESLPVFQKYYKKKAEFLGYNGAIHIYDIVAPIEKTNMNFTYIEAEKFILECFTSFNPNMAEYAKKVVKNKWIDAEPRAGKVGGAFCTNIHGIKESRILCNFGGNFKYVLSIAHELGHAYHGNRLFTQSYINGDCSAPLGETASLFSESIVTGEALKRANKEEKFSILESQASDAAFVVVEIYSRFLFEKEFFKRRKTSQLSVEEIKRIMKWAYEEAFGDSIDLENIEAYSWINKPHYYFTDTHYYNFPYTFGLLFAKGLYAQYLKKGDKFIREYDNFLGITGKGSIRDIANSIGIDVNSIEFWRSSLNIIESGIQNLNNI